MKTSATTVGWGLLCCAGLVLALRWEAADRAAARRSGLPHSPTSMDRAASRGPHADSGADRPAWRDDSWKASGIARVRPTRPRTAPWRAIRSLHEFAVTGDLQLIEGFSEKDIRDLARQARGEPHYSRLMRFLKSASKMPSDLIPDSDADAFAGFVSGWLLAIRGDRSTRARLADAPVPVDVVPIAFSTAVGSEDRILATSPYCSTDSGRIHAVFESVRWRGSFQRVFAVWKNLSLGRVALQEVVEIDPSAGTNQVWLRFADGWTTGLWQLEIFDPEDCFVLLGHGRFVVE